TATKLLVVDSILPILAPLTGGATSSFPASLLMHVARALRACAQRHNLAVLVTNGIVEGSRPALGMHWALVPTTSALVERARPRPASTKPQRRKVPRRGPSDEEDAECEDDPEAATDPVGVEDEAGEQDPANR